MEMKVKMKMTTFQNKSLNMEKKKMKRTRKKATDRLEVLEKKNEIHEGKSIFTFNSGDDCENAKTSC